VLALAVYYAVARSLPNLSLWWEVALLAFVVIPAVFALVYLALPLWRAQGLLLVGLAFVALAAAFELAELNALSSFAKLAAMTLLAFWFLSYFEAASWVALVAAIIPLVDVVSVFRGPTGEILEEKPQIYERIAFAFPVPGEHAFARLGPPDLLFFALFLGATARFGLRTAWTWAAMTASFGATLVLAAAFNRGLPALPFLSLGFLAPNADLLWRKVRSSRRQAPEGR
jgi:hypothetical protein